jgi:uracil-DNA glycosylase
MAKASPLTLLRLYLDQLRSKGSSHVPLYSHGRTALNALVKQPPTQRQRPTKAAPAQPTLIVEEQAPATLMSRVIQVPGTSLAEKLSRLAAMAEEDTKPRSLGTLRDTMVFAVGDPNAPLMFVGEAPGSEEESQREPFVGPAGQLLTKIIAAMGLKRQQVYISNICKFRPAMEGFQGMKNRAPTPEEMDSCLKYVLTEIDLIRPRCIVALGATAATGLGIAGKVGALRGQFHQLDGIPVMVTYHPSYLLRQDQNGPDAAREARLLVWQDILMVMEKLGMEISAKQRDYFQPKG